MTERTLSKARVAALLGISKQLVQHHTRKALREALAENGDVRIDHPAAVAWLASRDVTPDELVARDAGVQAPAVGRPARAPTRPRNLAPNAAGAPPSTRDFSNPPNVEDLGDLTFREIAQRYGSLEGFEGWIDGRKKVAETRRIELQNKVSEGKLIEREYVKIHVLGLIEGVFIRLLRDSPSTLSARVIAQVRGGETREVVEHEIREHISAQLAHLRAQASRRLRASQSAPEEDVDETPKKKR